MRVLDICSNYGEAHLLKASLLSQSNFEIIKNKTLSILGKIREVPKIIGWSLYWFGLRVVFPFREIKLWKRSRDLVLITKGLEDTAEGREEAIFIFNRKGKIKYFNKAAEVYVGELGIGEIKKQDDIVRYLHPEFLRETEKKLFSLGKDEFFLFEGRRHSFKLKQLYRQDEHIGAKVEIE
jgi:PAS domain-containing protein